jgi:hypothetical protein
MKQCFTFLLLFLFAAAIEAGERKVALPGSELFAGPIRQFKIEVAAPDFEKLRRQNRNYVSATVTVGEAVFQDVAVRLKGQGSFRPLTDKPSFALKFDEFVPKQKLFGLSKIMLNNSVQDTSLLSEYVATSLFRDAGVPAARVTHARVSFNGRDLGLYVLIEAMNKTFLKQHFRNANGNLYEGYAKDIGQTLEHDGGPPGDQSDLRSLVAAAMKAKENGGEFGRIFDVDGFYSFLGVTMLIAQHDSYVFNRNNYRLYHDPASNRFTMIPHGIDGTFRDNSVSIRPPAKYVLTRSVLESTRDREIYRERVSSLFTNIFKLEAISNRVEVACAKLREAVRSDQERTNLMRHSSNFLQRVALRHARVAEQLSQPEPPRMIVDRGPGVALTGWEADVDQGTATLEKRELDGRRVLSIENGPGPSLGVWRTRAMLDPGQYRVSGQVQTSNVVQRSFSGAAIRTYKMYATPRRVVTGSAWQNLEHHFVVNSGEEEVEFICELSAANGQAWFDLDSIRVARE